LSQTCFKNAKIQRMDKTVRNVVTVQQMHTKIVITWLDNVPAYLDLRVINAK